MNLEEQITEQLGKEIAKEIDAEILYELYKEIGWQSVVLDTLGSRKRSINILEWCEANCNSGYHHVGRKFVFEDSREALLFIMAWGLHG